MFATTVPTPQGTLSAIGAAAYQTQPSQRLERNRSAILGLRTVASIIQKLICIVPIAFS